MARVARSARVCLPLGAVAQTATAPTHKPAPGEKHSASATARRADEPQAPAAELRLCFSEANGGLGLLAPARISGMRQATNREGMLAPQLRQVDPAQTFGRQLPTSAASRTRSAHVLALQIFRNLLGNATIQTYVFHERTLTRRAHECPCQRRSIKWSRDQFRIVRTHFPANTARLRDVNGPARLKGALSSSLPSFGRAPLWYKVI